MHEDIEIWKDVKGFEHLYSVSNWGKVWSKTRNLYMSISYNKKGYSRLTLSKNRKIHSFLLHKLVALHFIDNPNNYPFINHLDGDKKNAHYSNLEWCTHSQNILHSFKYLNRKAVSLGKFGSDHHRSKKIYYYNDSDNLIGEYGGVSEAARKLNISRSVIHYSLNSKKIKIGGYFLFDKINK